MIVLSFQNYHKLQKKFCNEDALAISVRRKDGLGKMPRSRSGKSSSPIQLGAYRELVYAVNP